MSWPGPMYTGHQWDLVTSVSRSCDQVSCVQWRRLCTEHRTQSAVCYIVSVAMLIVMETDLQDIEDDHHPRLSSEQSSSSQTKSSSQSTVTLRQSSSVLVKLLSVLLFVCQPHQCFSHSDHQHHQCTHHYPKDHQVCHVSCIKP